MVDRVMTILEVDALATLALNGETTAGRGLTECEARELITSHRILHRRHRQLLRRAMEFEQGQRLDIEMERARK